MRAAVGASQRVASWAPALRASIATADYLESGRLSFEIRSALRSAEIGLADLERHDPAYATRLTADIAAARAELAGQQGELASLLRAAPMLEHPGAGTAEAEADWRQAQQVTAPKADRPKGDASWASEAAPIAAALGLGHVAIEDGDAARVVTSAEDARGVALGGTVHLHPDRVQPGTADGREVLAHELVHLAQSRLPLDQDAGRDAAEDEAADIARAIATGGPARRPQHHIDLSRPAADRHATRSHGRGGLAKAAAASAGRAAAATPVASPRTHFTQQLAVATDRIASLRTLVERTPSERVDVSRKQAQEIQAAIAAVGVEIKQLRTDQTAMEAHEYARMVFDFSHLSPVATLKQEHKRLAASAASWTRETYAADAFVGVRLWLQVADEVQARCNGIRVSTEAGPGTAGPYSLLAEVKDDKLMGYLAFHRERQQYEWLVGADDVDAFVASVGIYAGAARAALPGSENVLHSQADGARGGHIPSNLELGVAPKNPEPGLMETAIDAVSDAREHAHDGPAIVTVANIQVRLNLYIKEAKRVADALLVEMDTGRMDPIAARDAAIEGRNEVMRNARTQLSPSGRATSEAIKADEGRSAAYLVERKTKALIRNAAGSRFWGRRKAGQWRKMLQADSPDWDKYVEIEKSGKGSASSYAAATEELGQRPVVSRAIITSAGHPNGKLTVLLRYPVRFIAGAVAVKGVADMVKHIRDAREGERWHAAAREFGGFAGGIVGAEALASRAVWLASLVVRTNFVILAVSLVTSFIGSAIGAKLGTTLADSVGGAADLSARALMPMGTNITGGGFTGMMERNQQKLVRGGVTATLEDLVFDYDSKVRGLEGEISKADDRQEMERLQLDRLNLLRQREIYDELYRAAKSGELDERELLTILEDNGL